MLAGRSKKLIKSFQPLRPHALALRRAPKNRKPKNGIWAMTRINPSKSKPSMEKTTDRKQADRKQIIFTEGAKGGGGKTTLLSSLADFFFAENIPVKLVDADIDNKSRGSLSHLFKG